MKIKKILLSIILSLTLVFTFGLVSNANAANSDIAVKDSVTAKSCPLIVPTEESYDDGFGNTLYYIADVVRVPNDDITQEDQIVQLSFVTRPQLDVTALAVALEDLKNNGTEAANISKSLVEAYQELCVEDLTEVVSSLDDAAKELNIKNVTGYNFVVTDMFDITVSDEHMTAIREAHQYLRVKFALNLNPSDKDIIVIHKVGDNWEIVPKSCIVNMGDGTLKVFFDDLCPVAILRASRTTTKECCSCCGPNCPMCGILCGNGHCFCWLVPAVIILSVLVFIILILLICYRGGSSNEKPCTCKECKHEEPVKEVEPVENNENMVALPDAGENQHNIVVTEDLGEYVAKPIVNFNHEKVLSVKLGLLEDETKVSYSIIRNAIEQYPRLKRSESSKNITYRYGRDVAFRIGAKGELLLVEFFTEAKKENADEDDAKPLQGLVKVRQDANLQYVLKLVEDFAEQKNLRRKEKENVDYTQGLVALSLREIRDRELLKSSSITVSKDQKASSANIVNIDEVYTDKEIVKQVGKAKESQNIVTFEDISKYFKKGETVDLASVKERIVTFDKDATSFKVLEKGTLNKEVNVVCDDYTLIAAKMIILMGGSIKVTE